MADRKWKCVGECGKEFGVGDWSCAPGIKHEVAPKEYYDLDAPVDPTGHMLRNSRHRIENIPPEISAKDDHGELRKIEGGWVEFVRGLLILNDAEKQYWLEKAGYGKATKDEWKLRWFTKEEKQDMRAIELDRKEREVNALLASVKASKQEPPKTGRNAAV